MDRVAEVFGVLLVQQVSDKLIIISPFCSTYKKGALSSLSQVKYILNLFGSFHCGLCSEVTLLSVCEELGLVARPLVKGHKHRHDRTKKQDGKS